MTANMFEHDMVWGESDFRLSVVPRWQVMPTIRKQSVAEHQHNVAKIAERLAVYVYGWDKHDPELLTLIRLALSHDDMEAVVGDHPSYTKSFVDQSSMNKYLGGFVHEPMFSEPVDEVTEFIVKAADYIDAAVFLKVEVSMGNKTVEYVLSDLENRFKKKCENFEVDDCSGIMAWRAYVRLTQHMFCDDQMHIHNFKF